jgi:cobalt-zinc-cadmium efflux system outer membrane protein
MLPKFFAVLICIPFLAIGRAQVPSDTLRLSLDSAEHLFISGNFSLLAARYNISAQQAQEIQARLYPNPNLAVFYSLYNTNTKKIFPAGSGDKGGELSAQLSQLIYLAGQRNRQVKMAQAASGLAVWQFHDLMRTLKYSLRVDFFNLYYLLQSASVYSEEIKSLQQVVGAFREQAGKGYIAEKEVVRVKAQLYTLLGEYNDLNNQINDLQSELRLLLRVKNAFIVPLADTSLLRSFDPAAYPLNTLLDSAFKNRPDLQIASTNVVISKLNYNYQKSLAVPNLTLSLAYDQQGSYVNNLGSLGAAIDLPFFNRNKGNILSAKLSTDSYAALQQSMEATVRENVFRSLQKAFSDDKMMKTLDDGFLSGFDRLLHEVLINYQKRNITLLDFLDFYEAYKKNILASDNILFNRLIAFEDINYYTGTEFFHP